MKKQTALPAGLPGRGLIVWVIYQNPRDFPGMYVLRPQEAGDYVIPAFIACLSDNVSSLRRPLMARGLMRMDRQGADDPAILELWL